MKKKISLKVVYLIIISISYLVGVLTYKYQLTPYLQLKMVYKKIFYKNKPPEYQISKKKLKEYMSKRENLVNIDPEKKIVKYSIGMNIWIDSSYFNIINNDKIDNLFLIQQERHNKGDIIINSKKKINIIRALCSLNDNSNYTSWKRLNYNLLIIGGSCIHDEVVIKEYDPGTIIIPSGGPVASDPIFISNLNNLNDIEIKIKKRP